MVPKRWRWYGVVVLALPAMVMAFVAIVSSAKGVPLQRFVRDPLAVAKLPFYTGAVSNLGVVLFVSAAAVAAFAASLPVASPGGRRMMRWFAALTGVLALDDLFQVHEEIFPKLVGPETLLIGAYGLLACACFYLNRAAIARGPYGLLVVAVVAFAASLGVDALNLDVLNRAGLIAEDGAKLVGIAAWLAHLVVAARQDVIATTAAARDARDDDRTHPANARGTEANASAPRKAA